MPLYSFLCEHDGSKIDAAVPMELRDKAQVPCPNCGLRMKRIPTSAMAVLWTGLWHDSWARREGKADGLGPERGF